MIAENICFININVFSQSIANYEFVLLKQIDIGK